jgi:hypothetical protein
VVGSVISREPDTTVEMMAHAALTHLSESHLIATAALPIELFLIWNQENSVWQQRLGSMADLEGPHFHSRMSLLAKYAQYLFNLQHNTVRTGVQQRMILTAYVERGTASSHELEKLRHENVILHSGARSPSEQDRELQVAYRRLSDAEHGWNYTHMLLDNTREEVSVRDHGILHLEHAYEA